MARQTGESYYLQATYRLAAQWEALVRYDAYYADRDDRDGQDFAAATRMRRALRALPGTGRSACASTSRRSSCCAPEAHRVDGTGFLAVQDNPKTQALQRDWNSFMLQASFRF
jgi:hypothetical protein